jgi:hypothetical protein
LIIDEDAGTVANWIDPPEFHVKAVVWTPFTKTKTLDCARYGKGTVKIPVVPSAV